MGNVLPESPLTTYFNSYTITPTGAALLSRHLVHFSTGVYSLQLPMNRAYGQNMLEFILRPWSPKAERRWTMCRPALALPKSVSAVNLRFKTSR